jgi:hypothetical protein
MRKYTKWWIAHPWHVSGTPESGNVPLDCDCGHCTELRERMARIGQRIYGR